MVFKCSVFGCRGNYTPEDRVSIFKFPKDPNLSKIWEARTMIKNFKVTSSSRICELHFRKEDVLREAEFFDEKSGRLLKSSLAHPKLKEGAVPMIMTEQCPPSLHPTLLPARESPRKKKRKLEDEHMEKALEASKLSDLEYQKRALTMASNDAPTSLEIDDVKTGDPIVKTEVIIDDGPSTSYSEIVTKEDGNQMDVDNNDDPIDILNDLCKLKIKVETTPDGITELSVDSPDFDRSGEDVMMSSEQVRRYLDFKIREYLKDSQVNKLMRLFKRSLELKEILKEKNEEYLKIQKLMDMIFRNQEKFLRQAGILPKIPMYSRGISVDLPFLPPSESLKLPKLYLDSNAAQSKPVSTTTTTKPTPTPSPVPNHPSNSSANKEKERIECIDLTDDQDSSDKSPKGSASSSGESHPAPLPPRPFVTPNDRYLKIPPRPRLKVKGDAQGIILQWDMPPAYNIKIHAAVTAYEIFGYQVVPKHTVCTLLWKKIGTVKAMTLPMACTLTQFQEGNKYFFAIRAMDGHNRCSHFSEALSIVYNSRHKGDKGSK